MAFWLPPQDPAAKWPPNRRPIWLSLHFTHLRSVPRQPNLQRKEQHQENSRSSLFYSFSPSSLINSTKSVDNAGFMRQRGRGKPFPLLPFGFPGKRSLETVFFITLRKVKTYGAVAAWFFGHKGASLLLVAQTEEGPWRQFSIPRRHLGG